MKILKIILSTFLVFSLINCAKEDIPPQGLQGEIGPAGEDGSTIHAGNSKPDESIGKVGDFYLDKTAVELYGPKDKTLGWGIPIVLAGTDGSNGKDGTNGTDGSQIFAGTNFPATGLGTTGDYYLRKTTFDLYGPKTPSGWGSPINLKGMPDILYSSWIDANWNQSNTSTSKSMLIPVTQLTNSQLRNNSVVIVYLSQYGTGQIYQMPSQGRWSNTAYSFTFGSAAAGFSQKIFIRLKSTNGADLTELQYAGFRGNRFRYVIIPVGIASGMTQKQLKELMR